MLVVAQPKAVSTRDPIPAEVEVFPPRLTSWTGEPEAASGGRLVGCQRALELVSLSVGFDPDLCPARLLEPRSGGQWSELCQLDAGAIFEHLAHRLSSPKPIGVWLLTCCPPPFS